MKDSREVLELIDGAVMIVKNGHPDLYENDHGILFEIK